MRHALLLTACLLPCLAQAATFQSFDVPGAYGTCGRAVASNGLVAGTTFQPIAIGTGRTTHSQAVQPFLYAAGQLSYPHKNLPAGMVTFTGVNRDRSITGNSFNGDIFNPVTTSFVYHHGTVTTPSAGTLPISGFSAITDRGVILGQASVKTPLGGGFYTWRYTGFLLAPDGTVTPIDDGSPLVVPLGTDARADRVVGYGFNNNTTGWLFTAGAFTPITYPGASFTQPAGVDEAGTISGSYDVGDLSPGGNATSHGFFLRHGKYTTFDAPVKGTTSTFIGGMNEADQITGCYTDAKGTHGFIRTP